MGDNAFTGGDLLETEALLTLIEAIVVEPNPVRFGLLLAEGVCHLLDATAAGVMLVDDHGQLAAVGSPGGTALRDLFDLQDRAGPPADCYRSGEPVIADGIDAVQHSWPEFADAMSAAGLAAVHALPIRFKAQNLGVLTVYRAEPGTLTSSMLRKRQIIQALATVAATYMAAQRALECSEETSTQLQAALDIRVPIEQAKGFLACQHKISPDAALMLLRAYCHSRNLSIRQVAHDVVAGKIDVAR